MAAGRPAPAAGSAAAVAAAMGAALAAKTARLSGRYRTDAEALADAADALRDRAIALAEADATGVTAAMTAGAPSAADPSAVPRQIAELADDLLRLADTLVENANPRLYADALAARCLAEAARGAVDAIVDSNDGPDG